MSGRTLIVDDSPILRRSIRRGLNQAGVADENILEAGNGQEALSVIEHEDVSLILLDLNMPVMNGEEFLEVVKADPRYEDITVIVVTTESNAGRLMKLGRLGVSGFLHKPFEPEDLREIARQNLNRAS